MPRADRTVECQSRKARHDGYVVVRRPGHPNADPRGWVLEHRLIYEQLLGRPLERHENVHHLNGDRADNRPENLELWVVMQPTGQRVDQLVEWARHVLALYAPAPATDEEL